MTKRKPPTNLTDGTSDLEAEFLYLLRVLGMPEPAREYRFDDKRKFRFDFCWVAERLAVEIEGGIFIRGRHVRPTSFSKDCFKYSYATLLGWRVIRLTSIMLRNGEAEQLLDMAFYGTGQETKQ